MVQIQVDRNWQTGIRDIGVNTKRRTDAWTYELVEELMDGMTGNEKAGYPSAKKFVGVLNRENPLMLGKADSVWSCLFSKLLHSSHFALTPRACNWTNT